jgi:hypothetical protein
MNNLLYLEYKYSCKQGYYKVSVKYIVVCNIYLIMVDILLKRQFN